MPLVATISDVQTLAAQEVLRLGKKILGVTASAPRYVSVPDEEDPDAVSEWVVDVQLLEGPSQQLIIGAPGGLVLVRNVLIATSAVGDLLADLGVPVEIERIITGQLQVTGRAKVALPTLSLTEYTYEDLQMTHVDEFEEDENGVLRDPFRMIKLPGGGGSRSASGGATVSVVATSSLRLSTADELDQDDNGNTIGLGINPFQRTIFSVTRAYEVNATEKPRATEATEIV